mmetsp:Transcript_17707/g.40850  ORF Transcript_17707/g.40850 Transcript_17707/m.40850 type:complete len:689 (+) Transcript_17707:490-2556(+)
MFKAFLSKSPPAAPTAPSNPSQSSPSLSFSSPSSSWKRAKMSPEKGAEDDRVEKQDHLETGDADDDVPELILPPGPPSTIEVPMKGRKDESFPSGANHPVHVRENSLETTSSQSMDLSSFFKTLNSQEDRRQKPRSGTDLQKKNADDRSDTPISASLSLAASQVDLSLAEEDAEEIIQIEGRIDHNVDDILRNSLIDRRNANNNADSCGNGEKVISDKSKSDEETAAETSPLKVGTDASVVGRLPKNSSSHTKTISHDPSTMADVGKKLFRESLAAEKKVVESENEKPQITAACDSSDVPSKENRTPSTMMKVATAFVLLIVFLCVALAIRGNGPERENDVPKGTIMPNGYGIIDEKDQGYLESNHQVQETTNRFNLPEQEQIISEEKNSVDPNKTRSEYSSSSRVNEGRKISGKKEQSQETISRVRVSDHKQKIPVEVKNISDPNYLLLHQSSTCHVEECTNNDDRDHPQETTSHVHLLMNEKSSMTETHISSKHPYKATSYDNDDKDSSKSDNSWLFGCFWSVILLLLVSHLISYLLPVSRPPSLSKEKPQMKSRVATKLEGVTPVTPTSASLSTNRSGFLTPPVSYKEGSHEPTKWMSPVYGEGAVDVSVYKAMKAIDLRQLLRERKCDTRGNKEQMIKMLVQSYQNELACMTVQQLRPKLRKRNLSQKGTKKDAIRRLVEAGLF